MLDNSTILAVNDVIDRAMKIQGLSLEVLTVPKPVQDSQVSLNDIPSPAKFNIRGVNK